MTNQTNNFDQSLPILSLMPYSDILYDNLSLTLESILSLSSTWNRTDLFVPSEESIILRRHPILYGTAIYALLLLIVGTIGNILTIIILSRPNLRRHTTMRYFIAVAIADLCSLYSWNLNLFYKHLINRYQNDLEDASIISCRLVSFIAFVSLQLSSWYLTLVSVDRCLSIHFLFWRRQLGRVSHSIYIILSVTIIIIFLNIHLLFLNGYKISNCIPYGKRTCFKCYACLNDKYYIFPKWETVHVIVYNLIPLFIMLISAYFMIRRSQSSHRRQRTLSIDGRSNSLSSNDRRNKHRQLTCVLISLILLFAFLTTPVMIYNVFLRNHLVNRKPLKYIVQGILLCKQFTHHAINFFVYSYGSSMFRRELHEFFSTCTRKTNYNINQSRASQHMF
ncbi:unnamed protein product [Rotaria sordida]|uniref:G-protein coupled receptors family 1 profile domain-containing protein n=1 Tax=Rotaria sordida TaxID=392033 RepID=A0A813UM41_9BILA|nr:unnamed protein product [Rotaria sordida]